MCNFFYIYSDLSNWQLFYGFATHRFEIVSLIYHDYFGELANMFYSKEPLPFYTLITNRVLGFLLGLFCLVKTFFFAFQFYIWSAVFILTIYLNYEFLLSFKERALNIVNATIHKTFTQMDHSSEDSSDESESENDNFSRNDSSMFLFKSPLAGSTPQVVNKGNNSAKIESTSSETENEMRIEATPKTSRKQMPELLGTLKMDFSMEYNNKKCKVLSYPNKNDFGIFLQEDEPADESGAHLSYSKQIPSSSHAANNQNTHLSDVRKFFIYQKSK